MNRFTYYNIQLDKKSTIQPLNMSISKLFQNALDIEASQFLLILIIKMIYIFQAKLVSHVQYVVTQPWHISTTVACVVIHVKHSSDGWLTLTR